MHNKTLKKYLGMLIFATLVVGIYKTWNTQWLEKFLGLLTPLFTGVILAYLLYVPCRKIENLINKTKVKFIIKRSRLIAVIAVYLIVAAIIYGAIKLLIPVLTKNLIEFVTQLPKTFDNLLSFLESHEFMGYSIDRDVIMETVSGKISLDVITTYLNFENILGYVEGIVAISSTLVNILIGVIVSIYLILEKEQFFNLGKRLLTCIFQPNVKNTIVKYTRKIDEFIRRYFYCRLLDALIMFFISFVTLMILKVPYAIVFATIVGVFNIVPYIGSILSTIIIIVFMLFSEGAQRATVVGIVMFILQQIDGNIIDPYIVKDKLKISPVWVIVAVILGGGFGGVIGIMLGVPIVAVIKLIANDIMSRREKALTLVENKDNQEESSSLQ